MKVYLAGPMRGYERFNFPAFDVAAAKLRALGFEVFSPAERDRKEYGSEIEFMTSEEIAEQKTGFTLRDALGADLEYICREADAIALLPGWEKSSGVSAELPTAKALGLTQIILGKAFTDA